MNNLSKTNAESYKELVHKRTGIAPEELECPREASDMTPCIARDGQLAVGLDNDGTELCVGCGNIVLELLEVELGKHFK